MLLSDRDIRAELDAGRVRLDPFSPELIQPSSIDVRMDRYFRVFENHRYPHIDPAVEQPDLTRLVEPDGDDPFVLHPGEFVLASTYEVITLPDDVAGRLEGKALAVSTPVPTPAGWRTMGDLQPGDEVFDEAGRPTLVVAATGEMTNRPCAEVVFSDGHGIVADYGHQWVTATRADRRHGRAPGVRTTREIGDSLRAGPGWNHRVLLAAPAQYPEQDMPDDPYALGRRLADGSSGSQVPAVWLRGSQPQRLALLQGLMDSGGDIDARGRCEFRSPSEPLAGAVTELAASLGLRPAQRKKRATLRGVEQAPAFAVAFTPGIPVFRLQRKLSRIQERKMPESRAIVAVRDTATVPVRCIQVASAAGIYLAGPRFVPTHNSSLGRLGLLTHSTAGWIDPGFSGHVTLELSNVATLPIKLWPGMKIGQLCLFRTSSPAEHPYGSAVYGSRYQDQRGPTPSRSYLNFYRSNL